MSLDRLPSAKSGVVDSLPVNYVWRKHLKDFITTCRVEGASENTLWLYNYNIEKYLKFIYPDNPTSRNVLDYLDSVKDRSPFTVHQYYRTLRRWFNWLVEWELMDRSPLQSPHGKGIKAPKLPDLRHRTLSDDELRRILLFLNQKGFTYLRNLAIVLIFLDSGIRAEEMSKIELPDVNIDVGAVRVVGKGKKERVVRISLATRRALLAYLRRRSDDYSALWVSEERRPMTLAGIEITIRKVLKYAGIEGKKTGAHTFRHTAAKNYLMNGGDLKTLQYMLGHSKISTTEMYLTDINDVEMFKVHEKVSPVEKLLNKNKKNRPRV